MIWRMSINAGVLHKTIMRDRCCTPSVNELLCYLISCVWFCLLQTSLEFRFKLCPMCFTFRYLFWSKTRRNFTKQKTFHNFTEFYCFPGFNCCCWPISLCPTLSVFVHMNSIHMELCSICLLLRASLSLFLLWFKIKSN